MAARMDRQEVLSQAVIRAAAWWSRGTSLLVLGTTLWLTTEARSLAQERGGPAETAQVDHEGEEFSPTEQGLLERLARLNQELSLEKRRALPREGPTAQKFAAQLATRAWVHWELGNHSAARDDVRDALQIVPSQHEALTLQVRLAGPGGSAVPNPGWLVAATRRSRAASGSPRLRYSLGIVLGSSLSTGNGSLWPTLLLVGWGLLWGILLTIGDKATREVNGSRKRLRRVAGVLAAMCLCPTLIAFWWGLLDAPSAEFWTVLTTGTLVSISSLSAYLRPPIQLPDQQQLPLVDDPEILARIEQLSNRMGVSPPKVRLWRSATDNQLALAFAGSLSAPQLVVTDGIFNRLSVAEADAILAHELAHIANRSLWLYAPLIPLAAAAACIGSQWGLGIAWGLGQLVFLGLNRLVSRPLEFDCDRRAALVVNPPAMISSLEKIHALLPIPNDGWLSALFYASATHPPLVSRIARLKLMAGEPLSSAEESQIRRIQSLGWLMFAVWLGSLAWGWWQLERSPQSASLVMIFWCALGLGPALLTSVATHRLRRQAALRLQVRRFSLHPVHWIRKIGWSFLLPAVAIFLIRFQDWLNPPASDLATPLGICLLVVWVGSWLIRLLRNNRLNLRINTLLSRGEYAAVVREFDAASPSQRKNPALQNAAALALALTGQTAQAVERLESLNQAEPDFPAALMSLATLQFDAGNYTHSEQYGARLTELLPLDPIGPFHQVLALLRMGRRGDAREVVQAAKSRISSPGLLQIAAAAVAVQEDNPDAALPLLESAERHLPGDCHLAILLIEWHLRRGETAQAHTCLEQLESRLRSNRLAFLDGTARDLRTRLETCEKRPAQADDVVGSADIDL